MRKRKIVLFIALSLILTTPVTALADTITVSGVDIVNNTAKGSDYKLTQQQSQSISSNLNTGSQYNQLFDNDNGRFEANLSQEYSYLINHNIISRGNEITASSSGVTIHQPSPYSMPSGQENATNFLMALYKATYGTINSRELVFRYPSVRNINGVPIKLSDNSSYRPTGYNGPATSFNYQNGDYYVYVSPNVPELYLSKLLSMGVITTDQIKDQNFLQQYQQNGSSSYGNITQEPWSNNATPYEPLNPNSQLEQVLGSSWNCQINNGVFTATRNTPNFMVQSNITTMQALQYIAKILQVKDNTLSQKEEEIIAYKYGCSYLMELPESERSTLCYLLAMGIINFQSPADFEHLYSPLTKEYAVKLLYRVANPAGRVDFKKIVMTDSDNVWMKKGFAQQPMQVVRVGDPIAEPKTVSVTENQGEATSNSNNSSFFAKIMNGIGMAIKERPVKYGASSSGNTTYTVVKEFLNPSQASYLGTIITGVDTKCLDVKNVQKVGNAVEVTFQIQAPSASVALAVINSRITLSNNADITSTIHSLTKISANHTTVSYISQADLTSSFSDITVLNDKTLRNKNTGAMAEFLTNDDMALVGNTVIHSPDPMVQMIDGQVYYNMAMVLPLLGNAYISNLDPAHLIVNATPKSMSLTPVMSSGNVIQQVPTVQLSNLAQGSVVTQGTMFDLNSLTHGVSTLIRNYELQNPSGGTPYKATVIVNWSYSMPTNDSQAISQMNSLSQSFNPLTAAKFLYTRPDSNALASWWDSNIGISNALANMMYGTTGGNYIRTGYLAPSVTVLCNTSNPAMQNIVMTNIFKNLQFTGSYVSNYLGGNASNWYKDLFNQYGNGPGSRRMFNYIGSSDTSGLGTCYNDKYFVTNTGSVYEQVNDDPRIDMNNGTIVVNGRTAPSNGLPAVGDIVSFNKNKFYVKALQNINGKYYMALASLDSVSSDVTGTPDGNNTGNIYNELTSAINNYTKGLFSGTFIPSSEYSTYSLPNSYLVPSQYLKVGGNYFAGGTVKSVVKSGNSLAISQGGQSAQTQENLPGMAGSMSGSEGTLYGNPVIYLCAEDYSDLNGFIVKNATNPFMDMGNIFYSGLNNSLITSVIANSEGATGVQYLPVGAKVIIADTLFQVTNNGLVSYPITNSTLVNSIASDPSNDVSVAKAIGYLYDSTALFMSGNPVPFYTYIESSGIGGLPSDINSSQLNGTLFSENGSLKYAEGKNVTDYNNGLLPKSVCIYLKLQSGVNFVCLSKASNLYTLETMSNVMGSNGQVGGGIFSNQLYFLNGNGLFSKYVKAIYSPLPNYRQMWSQFLSSYRGQWWKNAIVWVKTLSTLILAYLICIFVYAYIVVKYDVGAFLFEALNLQNGYREKGNGIDIISLLTFGLLSIEEDPPPLPRIFVFFSLLFIAVYMIQVFL